MAFCSHFFFCDAILYIVSHIESLQDIPYVFISYPNFPGHQLQCLSQNRYLTLFTELINCSTWLYSVIFSIRCKLLEQPKMHCLTWSVCPPISPIANYLFISQPQQPYTDLQFSSVTQTCLTLCDSMNHSMPGLPVKHQLLEFTRTHIHRLNDAIQPSHPLFSPSPSDPIPPSIRSFPMS